MVEVIVWTTVKFALIVVVFGLSLGGLLTWVERKQSAVMQDRIGPNRASVLGLRLFGVMHLLADALKMLAKENFIPDKANKILFFIAPGLSLLAVLVLWAVVPFGPGDAFILSDVDTGILVIFAVASLGVYGNIIGAWASYNKWSLLGGMRVAAQMVSYEVSLGLSVVGIFMVYESVNIADIVVAQGDLLWGFLPKWGIVTQPLAFLLFMTASIAENKRAPFDVAEADNEIVSGYFTEYSALGFGTFFIAEFAAIVVLGAVAAALFLGGWQIPWVDAALVGDDAWWLPVLQCATFIGKTLFLIWLMMLIRWTLPRFRYDQIMRLGWKVLLPLALLNVVLTGVVLRFTVG
jgi:NADH-quinone oxidoreductase subunit H